MMIGCKQTNIRFFRMQRPHIDIEFKNEPIEVSDEVGKFLIETNSQIYEVKGEFKPKEVSKKEK